MSQLSRATKYCHKATKSWKRAYTRKELIQMVNRSAKTVTDYHNLRDIGRNGYELLRFAEAERREALKSCNPVVYLAVMYKVLVLLLHGVKLNFRLKLKLTAIYGYPVLRRIQAKSALRLRSVCDSNGVRENVKVKPKVLIAAVFTMMEFDIQSLLYGKPKEGLRAVINALFGPRQLVSSDTVTD